MIARWGRGGSNDARQPVIHQHRHDSRPWRGGRARAGRPRRGRVRRLCAGRTGSVASPTYRWAAICRASIRVGGWRRSRHAGNRRLSFTTGDLLRSSRVVNDKIVFDAVGNMRLGRKEKLPAPNGLGRGRRGNPWFCDRVWIHFTP